MLNAIADKWPGIRDVQSSQVEPIYDKDGAILNADEWTKAPIIGVFPIRDASSFSWEDKAPYGAMVYAISPSMFKAREGPGISRPFPYELLSWEMSSPKASAALRSFASMAWE